MAVVHCPDCRTALEVADRLLADPVACGACGAVFDPQGRPPPRRARPVEPADDDEYEERPRRRRRRYDDDEYDGERPDPRLAYLPGLLSAVVCLLTVLLLVGDIVAVLAFPQAMQNNPLFFGMKPPPAEVLIGFRVFALVWLLVVLAASFRMMSGRNHPFCVAGMAMHLLPCSGVCWPFGLAVGIWGLIVLHRPEVRDGFEEGAGDDD